ncbi:MAG: methyltransferase domain-containing protein [Candidatus Sungbacteria bacterium]|nr:methyltransferase domain-containing protein [Candidatus Sungbacteria bacterium]
MIDEELAAYYDKMYQECRDHFISPILGFLPTSLVPQLGGVLDIGCGSASNSIELARRNFCITCFDISSVAVAALEDLAGREHLPLIAKRVDILQEGIQQNYAIIICSFVLHHLMCADGKKLIDEMRKRTIPGGVNIVTAHTTNGHFFQSGLVAENYYPEPWELHAAYSDWKFCFYEEAIAQGGTFEDGSPMYNQNSYLLAQKPAAP